MIDLHVHTTASDGSLTPSELVAYASRKDLEAVAVTDHDTVEGVAEAADAGAREQVEVVPGVEISAQHEGGTLHILGYYIDVRSSRLLKGLEVVQEARRSRNPRLIENLQKLGIDITLEEVALTAAGGQIGRPHVAQVLVKKGYVKDARQAFCKYLQKGAAAYEPKFRIPPAEALSLICSAGGIAVLAHPFTLSCKTELDLDAFVCELAGQGLQGIEVYYPEHSTDREQLYARIARRHGLLLTGGSDFHGPALNDVDLGTGRGSLRVPYRLLAEMKKTVGIE